MEYTNHDVINMLINANLLSVSSSCEYIEYWQGKKGIFSIPGFSEKFYNWSKEKSEKAVLDKAALCQKLMNNKEPYLKILKTINKQPLIYNFSSPTREQAIEIILNDINSIWIKKIIEVSCNKDQVIQDLLSASSFEITETGWHANITNIDDVIPYLVNDSNLHILIEYKNANNAFINYLNMKYPHYSKYIKYIVAYLKGKKDFGVRGKSKTLELCKSPRLYLSEEFDNDRLNDSLKGEIIIKGAGRIVKELAANLKCSKAEATKLVAKGKITLSDIIYSEYDDFFPLRDPDWQAYRWWKNKEKSTEWDKTRTTYLPTGKAVHWRWLDRADEIRAHHIHNDNESPSVVMNRVFQEAEEKCRADEEELKAKPNFPECPLKGNEEFRQVESPLELYHVGKIFENCAFTYEKALERGDSFIFTSSEICAEICKNREGKWRIQQCLGRKNSIPLEESIARFENWFRNALRHIV